MFENLISLVEYFSAQKIFEQHEEINKEIKDKLLSAFKSDQDMRKNYQENGFNPEFWDFSIDKKNIDLLKEIIKEHGWPTISMVGEDAAQAAWAIAQHADKDKTFQKEALKLLKDAVKNREADKRNEAYLEDRVRVNSGKPQLYGTQFGENKKGEFGPMPIEDEKNLDSRRKTMGLEPFEEYKKSMESLVSK